MLCILRTILPKSRIYPFSAGVNYYLKDQSCVGLGGKVYQISDDDSKSWNYLDFQIEANYARMLLQTSAAGIGLGATARVHGDSFTEHNVFSSSHISYGGDLSVLFNVPKNHITVGLLDFGSKLQSNEDKDDNNPIPTSFLFQDEFAFSYLNGSGEGKDHRQRPVRSERTNDNRREFGSGCWFLQWTALRQSGGQLDQQQGCGQYVRQVQSDRRDRVSSKDRQDAISGP